MTSSYEEEVDRKGTQTKTKYETRSGIVHSNLRRGSSLISEMGEVHRTLIVDYAHDVPIATNTTLASNREDESEVKSDEPLRDDGEPAKDEEEKKEDRRAHGDEEADRPREANGDHSGTDDAKSEERENDERTVTPDEDASVLRLRKNGITSGQKEQDEQAASPDGRKDSTGAGGYIGVTPEGESALPLFLLFILASLCFQICDKAFPFD